MMFKRFIRLWQGFCKVIFSKKKWCWPRQSEVLILDAASEVLAEYLEPWNPEVLHMRGEQFYIPVLLASFLRRGNRVDAYMDCFIEKVSPRLVVTFMDHYENFYTLSKRFPNIKTLFVQHALRGSNCPIFEKLEDVDSETTNDFLVDYMLVFGSGIGNKYSQCIAGETVVMGSVKNNKVPREKLPQSGVIALISEWRQITGTYKKGVYYSFEEFFTKPDRLLIQCLVQYAKTNNKRLMIIPNRLKHSTEDLGRQVEDYYRKLLGSEPEFLCPSGSGSAYHAVDSAEIVVAINSTLGCESIARGNKTAILSFRGAFVNDLSMNYGWPGDFPDEGLFWTNNPDPDSFVRILDYLFAVDDEQWRKDVRGSNFSSIMEYDTGNLILKGTLERILGASDLPQ
jgi:surface carbohydrate biosynthesis protein